MDSLTSDIPLWQNVASLVNLKTDEIHLFCIDIEAYFKNSKDYKIILSDEELIKSERFKSADAKITYLTTRCACRKILSAFLKEPHPSKIHFQHTKNKKPTINGLEFNLSHSGNRLLLAVSPFEIGVDVEYLNRDIDFEPLLDHSFSKNEIKAILNDDDQIFRFYQLWTKKEALLKATGEGLVDNLPAVEVCSDLVLRKTTTYKTYNFIIDQNYVAALAVQQNPDIKINFWRC